MSRKTIEELLKLNDSSEPIIKKSNIKYNDIVEFPRREQLKYDEDLKDRASNRNQREEFTKKILFMMACELVFIAFLLLGVFATPYVNSLLPRIQLNLPPIFLSVSIILILIVSYKFSCYIPTITIRKGNHFNIQIDTEIIFKYFSIILFLIIINCLKRHPYTIYLQPIILPENIINMIIYASITVFVKTTILARLIINGLYDVLRKK